MNKVTVRIYDKRNANGNIAPNFYENVVLPFKYGKFLDEQLDYAVITLERIPKKRFDLLDIVNVSIRVVDSQNQEDDILSDNMLIVNDESFESPVGSGLYRHEITVIEATKLAEGIQVESLCFTNANGNDYTKGAVAPILETTQKRL